MLLYNVLNFYETSAPKKFTKTNSNNLIDRWIISRLNQITKEITESIEKYDLPSASRTITLFIDDLSWYLRLSRENLNEGDTENMSTMKEVLENISILIAPFMPFTSEYIWQSMTKNNFDDKNKSVHLESWSEADKKIDVDLLDKMKKLREIISIGLKQRDQNSVGLKWPLNKVIIYSEKLKGCDEIIKKQLNVKEIEFKSGKNLEVELDFNLTPELEAEGYARELSRNVQAFRKELGLQKKDKIELFIFVDEEFKKILKNQKEFIKERTNSKILKLGVATPKEKFKNKIDFNIKDKRGIIAIKY
jgi:isoleucyl-tRNA synthetase